MDQAANPDEIDNAIFNEIHFYEYSKSSLRITPVAFYAFPESILTRSHDLPPFFSYHLKTHKLHTMFFQLLSSIFHGFGHIVPGLSFSFFLSFGSISGVFLYLAPKVRRED